MPHRRICPTVLLVWAIACVADAIVRAQAPHAPDWQTAAGGKLAFEVASVKPTTTPRLPNFPLDAGDAKPRGGRFSASFSLGAYIFFAYKLDIFELQTMSGQLLKWAIHQDYAIDAEADGNPTKDQMRLMMQSLLADRFKLKVHFETKEVSVMALTLVKPGKLGPKLRPHSEGPPCPDSYEMPKLFAPIAPPKPGEAYPSQCGTQGQLLGTPGGTWFGARDTTMELLAHDIYGTASRLGELDKPVVDQTGLEGRFDYVLELPAGSIPLFPKPPDPDNPSPDPKGAIFLNAVREQLGLKLLRSRGQVGTFIIDHIEQPSEN
jgi:bla regulator protein BlaR1